MLDTQEEERSTHRSEEDEIFFCRFENNKLLVDLLINLTLDTTKDCECFVEATPEILMFSVIGRGKSLQAKISLPCQLFDEYSCSHENISFVVKLITLLDCLRLFGVQDSITTGLSYSSSESLLKISLEESGILTICEITCLYIEDIEALQQGLILAFRNSEEQCQIIIKSESFRDSLHEIIDSAWIESIEIEVNSLPQYLKIIATGSLGISEILIPRSSDTIISFQCTSSSTAPYNLKSLTLGMKALTFGKETFLRINGEGILCLQHQIESLKGENVFYDFLLLPEQSIDN